MARIYLASSSASEVTPEVAAWRFRFDHPRVTQWSYTEEAEFLATLDKSAYQTQPLYLHPLEQAASAAARDVLAERRRQIDVEGWTPDHDDSHIRGEIAGAGACYALYRSHIDPAELMGEGILEMSWPWAGEWWKPKDCRRDLVRAAALLIAEIERLDRAEHSDSPESRGAA